MTRHELLDGVRISQSQTSPCRIPSLAEKEQIQPGDHVKMGFVTDGHREFVWAKVLGVNGDNISAILDDDPVYADVRFGDQIEIKRRHVLGIER